MGAKPTRGQAAGAIFAAMLAAASWAGRPASAQQPGNVPEPKSAAKDYDQRALEMIASGNALRLLKIS